MPVSKKAPCPTPTLELRLLAIEGVSIQHSQVATLGSFFLLPSLIPVHKTIVCMAIGKNKVNKVAVGYDDGCVAIWDIVRSKCTAYVKT